MKYFFSVFIISWAILCCTNKNVDQKKKEHVSIQTTYDSLLKDYDIDSLVEKIDCPDEEDSLIDKNIKEVQDSIVNLYDQLILRLEIQSNNEKLKEYAIPFVEALKNSKKEFSQLDDADADLFFYSFGKATGAGSMTRCFRLNLLQNRLRFLKSIFGNSYWNYGLDTLRG